MTDSSFLKFPWLSLVFVSLTAFSGVSKNTIRTV